METFTYRGLTFKPIRNLTGKATEFSEISRRIKDVGITPKEWDYNEFYLVAKKYNAEVDLFEVKGKTVIAGNRYLFEYK